ncbi:aminotransferase class III-fold pyridoxal phosphate-dependent enzyme [Candidatus Woesearchaeota archaeon]|jgi:glutamate-1-semialdehyde 2,1-aminomutase|nr:aminotransferase class III-fold pyridoxal phosphate-dependent enzyme [Candidatus Woesearchaeota archaeon]
MKIIAIVQARMGSTRLPGKVLKPIVNKPMIELLLTRLSQSKELDQIVVATSMDPKNDQLQMVVESLGFRCIKGSENDVLSRYYTIAKSVSADVIVRITGDCPLVDPVLVDKCIREFKKIEVDYLSNTNPATYPDGLDVEVMSFASLEKANNETNSEFDREHVTPFIRNNNILSKSSISHTQDLSSLRWTVDEPEDLIVVTNIFEYFSPDIFFNWQQVLELSHTNPGLFHANQQIKNNEGATMNTGQKLYKRAKKVIPGGNMLLSKRPEMFLPEKWPAYFRKSKGCKVWDLDGKEYIDMSIMGIGTNILGYGHPEVDEAVMKTIKDGNMSTLNCPEEVYLAEKLVDLHPWADMVRFARSGGEINSVAIRIARASTGKDKIAICGYHGWHDWYVSANLNNDKNLDGHLLPGIQPNGVPRCLTGTTLPFNYNDIKQLEQLIKDNNGEIAAIKMEVSRNEEPKDNFLQKVRDLATENNIILIFDECTSGFRATFGGLHKKYDVEPDIAIFAKALGNGYAISACIGRQEFMQAAQQTFISSTFWTERIGPTAALKVLEVMEREKSWETITQIGSNISNQWQDLADNHDLSISTWGLPALSGFTFNLPNALSYKTLITQEMLKKGYLAANSVYVCIDHTQEVLSGYISTLKPIFAMIKDCENGADIDSLLEGPVCHSGFTRLN